MSPLVAALVVALVSGVGFWVWRRRLTNRLNHKVARATGQVGESLPLMRAVDELEHLVAHPVAEPESNDSTVGLIRESLETLPLGVVLVDSSGSIAYDNEQASAFLTGRHGDAVVAQAIDDLAAEASRASVAEREVQLFGPPRRVLHVSARVIGDDERRGVIVLIDDVTDRQRLDTMRRDFVANISHELRTPIGALSLLAETLLDETDADLIRLLSERIRDESQRLANTVDDLMHLSRIEHDGVVDDTPVSMREVISAAEERVRSAAEQRQVEIVVSVPSTDLTVRGDSRQLTSAVYNLLDNAVKYTPPSTGSVSVRARHVGECVSVVVQDNGIGIPRADLDRVFERFYRVDRGRSRTSGGTGLGLSIVRHIAVNHGGVVRVESAEGEGTIFTLELPAFQPAEVSS